MHINDHDFVRRRILKGSNEYTAKKRWDQNAFGSQRNMLINHVEKTLKQHEKDGDILEKFRREAQEMKQKKRRQRFPYLFKNDKSQEIANFTQSNQNVTNQYVNEFEQRQVFKPQQLQQFKQRQSFIRSFQAPQMPQSINHPSFPIPAANPFELQARVQYQRTIAQKDMQLYKREQKIKRQKKQINKLYRQLKKRERDDELEKYLKSQEEVKKMNQMLTDMKEEINSRKSLLQQRNDVLVNAHQEADKKKNNSELYLNSFNSMRQVKDHLKKDRDISLSQRNISPPVNNIPRTHKHITQFYIQPIKNPQISYSPQISKNRSSVFEKVPLYSTPLIRNNSLNEHLDELKNYNQRLQYLHANNRAKLSQIA